MYYSALAHSSSTASRASADLIKRLNIFYHCDTVHVLEVWKHALDTNGHWAQGAWWW